MPRRSGKFYRKNEAEVMKSLGLMPTKNSGSGWLEKEDGQNEYVIAQLKSTDAESIRVNLKDVNTLFYNSLVAHKLPIFVIQFLQTNDILILVKPADLADIAQYIECGKTNIHITEDMINTEEISTSQPPIKIISSGDRTAFYKEREESFKNVKNNKNQNNR